MLVRIWAALAVALMAATASGAARAAPKAVVFPFDLEFQRSEEDFFYGTPKVSPEEQNRLRLAREELNNMIAASGRFEMLDIAPVAADISAAAPLNKCNGCEMDFAKKLGADVLFLGVVEKASATLLSMTVIVVDVAKGGPIKEASAVVHGNTDDAWLGVTRWLARNRIVEKEESK